MGRDQARRRRFRARAREAVARHREAASERGAVLVEAAIIIPLVLLLTFGVIEYGLAFHDAADLSAATRAGARAASAIPKPDDPTPPETRNAQIVAAVNAVGATVRGIANTTPQQLWIYQVADGTDHDPVGGSLGDGSCTHCAGFGWDATTRSFDVPLNGTGAYWSKDEQNACPDNADRLGVYVKAQHRFITGLFGSARTLTSTTVMTLEPYVNGPCDATAP